MNFVKWLGASTAAMSMALAHAALFSQPDWERDDCIDKHSFAWCFVHNMTKRPTELYQYPDAELGSDEYQAFQTATSDSLQAEGALAAGTGKLAGIGAANGLSALAHSTMFKLDVVSSILTATDGNERFFLKYWIIVDGSKPIAAQEQEAATALDAALRKVLAFEYDGTVDFGKATSMIGISKENVWLKVKADGCTEQSPCLARTESSYYDDLKAGSVSSRKLPRVKWMPTADARLVEVRDDQFPRGYVKLPVGCIPDAFKGFRSVAGCERVEGRGLGRNDLLTFSAALPASFWIWSPLDKADKHVLPMLLNQGKAYYFVRPQPTQPEPPPTSAAAPADSTPSSM